MEADGVLLFLEPAAVIPKIMATQQCVSWSALNDIYQLSGLPGSLERIEFIRLQEPLPTEGTEQAFGGVIIYTLSKEWLYFCEALVEQGNNIELYGYIDFDGGTIMYFAVRDGLRFVDHYSSEGDEQNLAKPAWLKLLPDDISEYFSAVTAEDDAD